MAAAAPRVKKAAAPVVAEAAPDMALVMGIAPARPRIPSFAEEGMKMKTPALPQAV